MPEFVRLSRPFLAALLLTASLPLSASADKTRAELDDRVRRSGIVFQEMRNAPDREIPADLLTRSRCVAVIPNVLKAAWVIGGRFGTGVLSCRGKSGEWSPPVFVSMGGGSFGLQAGASSTDVVLFFMTTDGVRSVLQNKVKLSGDAGVAAGPVGREAEAATDGQFRAQIYSYARSRGLFAGVSLAGAYIGVNDEDTATYYGKSYSTSGILFEGKVASVPKSTWAFLGALPRPPTAAVTKPPAKKTAKAAPPKKTAPKARADAPAAAPKTPSVAAVPPPPDFGEASGTANTGGEAWGTAAAGGDQLGGEAWGTAASGEASGSAAAGEASGTAAAPPAPEAPPPPR